jgi:hypothetical protein
LKRGKARTDEIEIIISATAERSQFTELREDLEQGKTPKYIRKHLVGLIKTLDAEAEEE